MSKRNKFGFTLIELLVAIAIIGVLTTLAFVNFSAARERGRDARRKADLRQVENALRTYYNDQGAFPAENATWQIVGCGPTAGVKTACSWGSKWSTTDGTGNDDVVYMNPLPTDPLGTPEYRYDQINADSYELKACLENKADPESEGDTSGWCTSQRIFIRRQ